MIAHFPGQLDVMACQSCFVICLGKSIGWEQAMSNSGWHCYGHYQLNSHHSALPLMFLSFLLTGLVQILWRVARKQPPNPFTNSRRLADHSLSPVVLVCTLTFSLPCSTAKTRADIRSSLPCCMPSVPLPHVGGWQAQTQRRPSIRSGNPCRT